MPQQRSNRGYRELIPRPHSLIIPTLGMRGLLAGCDGPSQSAPAVFPAPQAPIARALTPTPALVANTNPVPTAATPAPQRPPATPAPIVAQAAPVNAAAAAPT